MLREDARAAMKPCGHCHDATRKSAIPSALRAFGDIKVPEPDRTRVQRSLEAEWTRRAALPPAVRTGERAP